MGTNENLQEAFAGESQANRKYLAFARQADAGKLLIGHFSSRYKKLSEFESEARRWFRNTVAVNDGDVFEVD